MSNYTYNGATRVWHQRTAAENRAIFNGIEQQTGSQLTKRTCRRAHNLDHAQKRWSALQMCRLVQLYHAHRCLWDINDSAYTNRMLRDAAIVDIAAALGGRGGQLTRADIVRKLHVLRTTYRYEKRRIKQRMRSGKGAKTKLKWFPLADVFLRAVLKSTKNTDSDSDLDDSVVVSLDQPTVSPMMYEDEKLVAEEDVEVLEKEDQQQEQECSFNDAEPDGLHESAIQLPLSSVNNKCQVPLVSNVIQTSSVDDLLTGKWPLAQSIKFLRLYAAHPCLWHLQDEHYRSAALRRAAIIDIATAMGNGLSVGYVKKKIKILRITYMQHRKRMLAERLAGKEPELQLRWYPLADCFLRPHIGLRAIGEAELAQETPQYNADYVYAYLNLIDPSLLTTLHGVGTQNLIAHEP